jgi:hypothetical protein
MWAGSPTPQRVAVNKLPGTANELADGLGLIVQQEFKQRKLARLHKLFECLNARKYLNADSGAERDPRTDGRNGAGQTGALVALDDPIREVHRGLQPREGMGVE